MIRNTEKLRFERIKAKKPSPKIAILLLFFQFLQFFPITNIAFAGNDEDGIPNLSDNFPNKAITTPIISSPENNEVFVDSNGDVTFSGIGEINTQVNVRENSTSLCTDDVTGDGLLIDGTLNSTSLVSGTIVDQFYLEATSGFPTHSVVIAENDLVSIFDISNNSLFLEITVFDITKVWGFNNKIYVASTSGIKVFNSSGENLKTYSNSSTPSINSDTVNDLFIKEINGKNYIAVATSAGVSIINETDNTSVSKNTGFINNISINHDEDKIAYSTGTTSYISDLSTDLAGSNFAVTNTTIDTNFNSGSTTKIDKNFLGSTSGLAENFTGSGYTRNITTDHATLPMYSDILGHWINNEVDRSTNNNNLSYNGIGITFSEVATGTDLESINFNGNSYFSSDSPSFSGTGTAITLGTWIKRPSTGSAISSFERIIQHGESENSRNYWISAGDNFFAYPVDYNPYSFGVRTDTGGMKGVYVNDSNPPVDTWEFIVGVYDGIEIKIYRNGVLESSLPHSGNIENLNEQLRIGYGDNDRYFTGNIALPFILGTDMSDEEILDLYNLTNYWFAENAKTNILGSTNEINDINCDMERNICIIATDDNIMQMDLETRLMTELSATGGNSVIPTYLGNWSCEKTSMSLGDHTITARAEYDGNISNVESDPTTFTLIGDIPVITNPIENEVFSSGNITFSGNGSASSAISIFNQDGPTLLCSTTIDGNGNWSCNVNLNDGDYAIYATDKTLNVSSVDRNFSVDTVAPDAPPTMDTLPLFTGTNYVQTTWSTVPDGNKYWVEIATDSNFTSVLSNSGWISNTAYTFNNLTNGTDYFFRVKGRDEAQNETSYSNITTTTIDIIAPATGTITNDDGSYSTDYEVPFSWTDFSDSLSGLDHFILQISDEPDFSNILQENSDFVGTSTSYTGTGSVIYYARVKGVDLVGNQSTFIQSGGTMVDVTPPTTFTLNQNATPSPYTNQILTWTTSFDNESGLSHYEVFRKTLDLNDNVLEDFVSIGTTSTLALEDSGLEDEHKYVYVVTAINNASVATYSNEIEIEIDTSLEFPPTIVECQNFTNDYEVNLNWANTDSNAHHFEIFVNGSLAHTTSGLSTSWTDNSTKHTANVYEYQVRAVTSAGSNGALSSICRTLYDDVKPSTTPDIVGVEGNNDWFISPVTISINAEDPGDELFNPNLSSGSGYYAGIEEISYNIDNSGITEYSTQFTVNENGDHEFIYYSIDQATNQEAEIIEAIKIDTELPTATFTAQNINPSQNNGFTTLSTISYISGGTDSVSGVDTVQTFVSFDKNGDGFFSGSLDFNFIEASAIAGSNSFNMLNDGKYTFKVIATDIAGNQTESTSVTIVKDTTAPITSASSNNNTITLVPNDSDIASGIAETWYTTDGSDPKTSSTRIPGTNINVGSTYEIKFYSIDQMGNEESVKTFSDDLCSNVTNPYGDDDNDGANNQTECENFTDPNNEDSDGDTILDGTEISDTTDPLNYYEHRVILLEPLSNLNSEDPITFVGNAPAGKVVTLKDSQGNILGTGTADPNNIIAIEISLQNGTNIISAEFEHNGTTVETPNISIKIGTPGVNPHFINVSESESVSTSFGTIIMTAEPDSYVTLFQILNGVVTPISQEKTDSEGNVEFSINPNFYSMTIFAVDQSNNLTSETITLYKKVNATGQVLSDRNYAIENATVQFIADGGTVYTTTTDANGNYTLEIPMNTTYSVIISAQNHTAYTSTVIVTTEDPQVSPTLIYTQVPVAPTVSTGGSGSLPPGNQNAKGMTLKYKGMNRGDFVDEDGVSLREFPEAYRLSMEQAQLMSSHREGKIITAFNRWGQEIFWKYEAGRIGSDEFLRDYKSQVRFTGEFRDEKSMGGIVNDTKRKEFRTSAPKNICPKIKFTIADFKDISNKNRYLEDVMFINAFEFMTSDQKHLFHPNDDMDWQELLEMAMSAQCINRESFMALKKSDLGTIENLPLIADEFTRTVYTALKHNIIDNDFDPTVPATREQALQIMFRAFPTKINEKATRTSFQDIDRNSELAPILVAAKKSGWFKNFTSRNFNPDQAITRAEFASWFASAVNHNKNLTKSFNERYDELLELLRKTDNNKQTLDENGKIADPDARVGIRETNTRTTAEVHLTGRAYKANKKPVYYGPTKSDWHPADPNTERERIKFFDKSENVTFKRKNKPRVLRAPRRIVTPNVTKTKKTDDRRALIRSRLSN